MKKNTIRNAVYVFTYKPEELTWRRIVFLPFNFYWRMCIALGGLVYFNLVVFEEVFLMKRYEDKAFKDIKSIISVFFVVDVVLSLLHRVWESVQKSMPYQPKSVSLLVIDVISLVPTHDLFVEPLLTKNGGLNWGKVWSMNACLRIYRVCIELFNLQQKMDLDPILVCFVQHNALMLCLSSFFGGIWYALGHVYKDDPKSWLSEFMKANDNIDLTKPVIAYVISVMEVFVLLNNTVVIDIYPSNTLEVGLSAMLLYIGFMLRFTYMLATMIASFLKCQLHMYKIKDHIAINKKCSDEKQHKAIEEYYVTYWNDWLGLQRCPPLNILPLCLQKDIMTDVYWETIEHSHLLRYFKINMKRQLSLQMRSKFMQPGDYIFRKGQVRSTFYYLASGVVQVMSHYDGVSPIITFTSGSCIGSYSLTVPSTCPTDVICATECELRFLTFRNYYATLTYYSGATHQSSKSTSEHIAHAKLMVALSKAEKRDDPVMMLYGVPQDDKLKWIKSRWRAINSMANLHQISENTMRQLKETVLPIDIDHTSKFLDLIVLSSESKWDADKCCLKTACPYVLEPGCNFIKAWHLFVVVLATIDCLLIAYCSAYLSYTPQHLVKWDHITCFAYSLDVYLQIITAVRSVDKTITEPMALLRHHLKELKFIFDIFATLPMREISIILIDDNLTKSEYLGFHRLFKLIRVFAFFKYQCSLITAKVTITYVLKYIYLFVISSHIAASLAFILACEFHDMKLVCIINSWFDKFPKYTEATGKDVYTYLMTSLIYVGDIFGICGLDVRVAYVLADAIYATIIVFISRNILTIVFAELMAMWIMKRQRRLACDDLISSLTSVMQQKGLHPGLANMAIKYIWLQWSVNYGLNQKLESTPVSEILSPIVITARKKDLKIYIKSIEFFNNMDEEMFGKVLSQLCLYTVPKGYIFCRSGERPSSFNILIKGCCNMTSMLKEDVLDFPQGQLLKPIQSFPLLEILQNIPCLQTTVALTTCEVASIDAEVLKEILFTDAHLLYHIKYALQYQMSELDVMASKMRYKKQRKKVRNFLPRLKQKSKVSQNISLIQYLYSILCIPYMINPRGNFIFIWETIKVIQVICSLLYVPSMLILFCDAKDTRFIFAVFLDIISFIDILIRLHLGIFHKEGFVIHQVSRYLTHAMPVDLISSMPLYLILYGYHFRSTFYLTVLTKSLQIYRVSGYVYVLERKFKTSNFSTIIMNFSIHLILVIYVMAACLVAKSCVVECQEDISRFECDKGTWIHTNENYINNQTPFAVLLAALHMTLAMMIGSDTGPFQVNSFNESQYLLFGTIIACIMKCYYLPNASAQLVGGNVKFTKHRERLKLFRLFISNEGADHEMASRILNHFVYSFTRLKGLNMKRLLLAIHPSLKSDLSFAMYYKGTKCLHRFVGENKYFMKILTRELQEVYFLKDSLIININQLNDKIYFVSEGIIRVIDQEDETIRRLHPGSMFGNFKATTKLRHKFKYVNQINTCILAIESSKFMSLFERYNKFNASLFLKRTDDREFVSVQLSEGIKPGTLQETSMPKSQNFLYKGSTFYQAIMFLLSILVPYMTAFPLLMTVVFDKELKTNALVTALYVFDVLSVFRIIIGLKATYTDSETGIYIYDLKRIRLAYLKTPSGFALDLLSLFPFEVVGYFVTQKWISILRLNRLLRIMMIISYTSEYKNTTYVRYWMRWSTFIINVTLIPYIILIVWMIFTCRNGFVVKGDEIIKEPHQVFVYAMNEIVLLITFSSSNTFTRPSNEIDCALIIIFVSLTFTVFPVTIASFTQKLEMSNYSKKVYQYKLYCVKLYLQLRDLSKSLLQQLWNYSLLLWSTNRGQYLPKYLVYAPVNLKCDLMFDLYGGHLTYNVLFEDCSSAFVYQLAGRLQRTVYFPGDVIVRKFDVDGRMYFINSGEVEAVDFDELNTEIVEEVFITGQCFGLSQGLRERYAHTITYTARNTVELLSLERTDFTDLLEAFPADKQLIMTKAYRIDPTEANK